MSLSNEQDELYFTQDLEQDIETKKYSADNRNIVHEKCFPPNRENKISENINIIDYDDKINDIITFPFKLDLFQIASINCINTSESVLVSAHTSAGKTAIAEYVIALCLKRGQRCVYTSPIKALSNQKYNQLYDRFTPANNNDDENITSPIGLLTGDVSINPNALGCLVMTTEILRNMLYRGSATLTREVGWVIFDEIHYLTDKERGVVWEETLILLSALRNVRFLFLSATIPNANEFACWIAKLTHQVCNVVYTDYRPVPLQHYVYPTGGDGLYLVVDENSMFKEDSFNKAISCLTSVDKGLKKRKRSNIGDPQADIYKIVNMIIERQYYPCIVFSFSKRDCESHALRMSKIDYNGPEEKQLIATIFNKAIDSLSDDDKKLKQVQSILPLLQRGLGIHHGGLLPILKEVIEILFQEGLLKILFSTETFSLGLNMPAKTVIFSNIRKFDGYVFRWITSGEYVQMSGRAGRRGIDQRGISILIIDETLDAGLGKSMLKGETDPLNSSFHLGYNMILSMLKISGANPEYIMSRSFYQFQMNRSVPHLKDKLKKIQSDINDTQFEDESSVSQYYSIKSQLVQVTKTLKEIMFAPNVIQKFLNSGRMVRIVDGKTLWDWGVLVNYNRFKNTNKNNLSSGYVLNVLVPCDPDTVHSNENPSVKLSPCPSHKKPEYMVRTFPLELLDQISCVKLEISDLRKPEAREFVGSTLKKIHNKFPDGIPLLDPIEDIKIKDSEFSSVVKQVEILENQLFQHPLIQHEDLKSIYEKYERKIDLEKQVDSLKEEIQKYSQTVVLHQHLFSMKKVLLKLGFCDINDVILLKGRVACEISTADELMVAELLFNASLANMKPATLCAMLSMLVFDEKCDVPGIKDELKPAVKLVKDTAKRIADVKLESNIDIDPNLYIESFNPSLMETVYLWCEGASFAQISSLSNIFEGSIIRCVRRLDELLQQMASATSVMGNTELETLFSEAIKSIKRDIVFAASLYL